MNECEQIHPLLRGYLAESISARERRLVARHLNLCASARKELDRLRGGSPKTSAAQPVSTAAPGSSAAPPAAHSAEPPSEPWDLKILRWMFKTPKPAPKPPAEVKKPRLMKPPQAEMTPGPSRSPLKPILIVVLIFGGLILLTHFIQNAGQNSALKGAQHWLSKKGYHLPGVSSSLELVLDLTNLTHWDGNLAPVAVASRDLITDADHLNIYWNILQPGIPQPAVDFTKNALAVVFLGPKATAGYLAKFKRVENFSDKTILWYDEVAPASGEMATASVNRPWVLQLIPKPTQLPVLIQKIQ